MTDGNDEEVRGAREGDSPRHEATESVGRQDDDERELGTLLSTALSEEHRAAHVRDSLDAIERRIRAIESGNLSRVEIGLAAGTLLVAGLMLAPATVDAVAALVRDDGLYHGLAPLIAGALAAAVAWGIDRLVPRR